MNITREQIEGWMQNKGDMSSNEFVALCRVALQATPSAIAISENAAPRIRPQDGEEAVAGLGIGKPAALVVPERDSSGAAPPHDKHGETLPFRCEAWGRRVHKCQSQCDGCFRQEYEPRLRRAEKLLREFITTCEVHKLTSDKFFDLWSDAEAARVYFKEETQATASATPIPEMTETLLSQMVAAWFEDVPSAPYPKREDEPRFFERMERVYRLLQPRYVHSSPEKS